MWICKQIRNLDIRLRQWEQRITNTGVYKCLRALEVVGVLLAVTLFMFEWTKRDQDSDVRIATLISTNLQLINSAHGMPGNVGQVQALEMLHRLSQKGVFTLRGLDLSKLNLQGVRLHEADLSSTNLSESNLNEADLSGAWLNSNLNYTTFDNANLVGAKIIDAALSDARFYDADITGVDFSNTTLTLQQIQSACYNPVKGSPPKIWRPMNAPKPPICKKKFLQKPYLLRHGNSSIIARRFCRRFRRK